MYKIIACFLVVFSAIVVQAQDTLKPRKFKINLVTTSSDDYKGYLLAISDSSIAISSSPVEFQITFNNTYSHKIEFYNVENVIIKRKGSVGRGAFIGAIIGLAVGAIGGLFSGDDPPDQWFAMTAGDKALSFGAAGAISGSLIGMLVGAIAGKTFPIKGRKADFDAMRMKMYN